MAPEEHKCSTSGLPGEIWVIVAQKMMTRDWVRARGACSAMEKAPLKRISMRPNQAEDLEWLGKHWSEARSLSLDMSLWELCVTVSATMMLQSCGKLPQLEDARLIATSKYSSSDSDYDEWAPWMAMLLMHAERVQTLSFKVTDFFMPLPTTLKHLHLEISEYLWASAAEVLQCLTNLETMGIVYQRVASTRHSFRRSEQSEGQSIGALLLRGCKSLHAVHCVDAVPCMLDMPPGCLVTVESDWNAMAEHLMVFAYTEKACLKTCNRWCLRETQGSSLSAERIASMFAGEEPLAGFTSLRLDCLELCSAKAPFVAGSCLQNLTDLEIHSKDDIIIGSVDDSVRLKRFVAVGRKIQLGVPDIASFAASIEQLYMQWSDCCPVTVALVSDQLAAKQRAFPEDSAFTEACFPASVPWAQALPENCRCGACSSRARVDGIFEVV